SPGPNYSKAVQQQATDTPPSHYLINPPKSGPYANLPQPNTTYALGLPLNVPDTRFPSPMPNGPHQISKSVPYQIAFTGDPPHRFFQMWQQFDEGALDLFAWVGLTVGIGPQNSPPAPTPGNTLQGSEAMGFWNMAAGDVPVFKFIADNYAIADNYHQSII